MLYNIILGCLTFNAIKAGVATYLFLIQFELDDNMVGKLYRGRKMAGEYYYKSLKSLGRKEEPLSGEPSRPPKIGSSTT